MGDIIDLKKRRKTSEVVDETVEKAPVMDITSLREQQIQDERREAKRTILNGFVGASVLIPGRGLMKITLHDISKGGLSFDLDSEWGHFREGEEIALRFYFSRNVYFPFVVRITSFRVELVDGKVRHGANFLSEQSNRTVLSHLVDFLESVVTDLKEDKGDLFINGSGV